MTDEGALLAAIAAAPAEDTPRLAYADWLDEHGRPVRAEFIRLQVDIARKQEALTRAELDRHVALFERQQFLLDNHRPELLGPLATLPAEARAEFDRGFVSRVDLALDEFLTHTGLVAGLKPLPWVRVTGVLARLDSFFGNPHLGCIAELSGYAEEVDEYEFNAFDWVGQSPRLSRLEVGDLEGCGVTDLVCGLANHFPIPSLRDLDLSNNDITDAGVVHLLDSPLPRQLKRLILGGNPIGDQGAIELADRWPRGAADKLEHLNLRFTNIGQPGQQTLTARFGGRLDLF